MLHRRYRLSRRGSQKAIGRSRAFRQGALLLRLVRASGVGPTRFAVTVGLRAAGQSAVRRSRLTRQLRAALIPLILESRPGYFCHVMLLTPPGRMHTQDLQTWVRQLFVQARLLPRSPQ